MKTYSENRKARYEYTILETFEAGLVLNGQEVKSTRLGRMQLAGSYVVFTGEEPFLVGSVIPPYQPKNAPADYNQGRSRKLLLNKKEISYLIGKTKEKGLTLIPLKVYSKRATIKLVFGIAARRKKADKREILKKREADREIRKALGQ